jgi:hypothetical protein
VNPARRFPEQESLALYSSKKYNLTKNNLIYALREGFLMNTAFLFLMLISLK